MKSFRGLLAVLLCLCVAVDSSSAHAEESAKAKQFLYVLRLVPRLHSDSAWTKEDNMALSRHFVRSNTRSKPVS
jgi:hypothetical protein